MKNNFFSIIIPTYKRSKILNKALDSIINQTYSNWEAIIIDNNSDDGTYELVKSYNDDRLHFFKINNEGIISKSRNLGIEKSNGEYLAFLDSDDWWVKTKLDITNKYINSGYEFVYHDMYIVKKKQLFKKRAEYCRNLIKPITKDLIYNGPAFPTSSVVLSKKIFKKVGCFNIDRNFITWEDYDAFIQVSKITEKFIKIEKCLGFLFSGSENTLKVQNQIDNMYSFKKKYLKKEEPFPNWCNYVLMHSFMKKKEYEKSLNYLFKINFNNYNFFNKLKLCIFYLIINFYKIIIK